jgi:hypothetical protein
MTLEEARALYPEVKDILTGISDKWERHYNVTTKEAEICQRDTITGEIVPILIINPACSYQDERFIERAPVLFKAAMTLLDEAFRIIRELQPPKSQDPGKRQNHTRKSDYAAECAMMCGRADFRRCLSACHGLDVADDERVKTRVRSILKIKSRGEINDDLQAAARWKDLRANFNAWKGGC